eukprot:2839509-Lingulodinium_polyedra.AAC.1
MQHETNLQGKKHWRNARGRTLPSARDGSRYLLSLETARDADWIIYVRCATQLACGKRPIP